MFSRRNGRLKFNFFSNMFNQYTKDVQRKENIKNT